MCRWKGKPALRIWGACWSYRVHERKDRFDYIPQLQRNTTTNSIKLRFDEPSSTSLTVGWVCFCVMQCSSLLSWTLYDQFSEEGIGLEYAQDNYFVTQKDTQLSQTCSRGITNTQLFAIAICCCFTVHLFSTALAWGARAKDENHQTLKLLRFHAFKPIVSSVWALLGSKLSTWASKQRLVKGRRGQCPWKKSG